MVSKIFTVQMDFLHSLTTAVAAPDDRGGMAVAARHTLQWLDDAQQLFPSPRLARTHAHLKSQLGLLEAQLEAAPRMGLVSERERKQPVYRVFVDPLPLTGPAESVRRLTALAGIAVAAAISRNQMVAPPYADSLTKVFKAHMGERRLHEDWYAAARAITQGETNLRPFAERCSNPDVKRFLLATLDLYESTLKPEGPDAPEARSDQDEDHLPQQAVGEVHEPEAAEALDTDEEELISDSEPVDVLRWQQGRAEFARFGDTMGLSAFYGRLPPQSLAPITTAVGGALRESLFDHEYALFAIYSLAFNLPPQHLIHIPIGAEGNVRLDPRGYVCWEMSSAFAADAQPAYVPLPVVVVERQQQLLSDRPFVKTIGELCLVPEPGKARKLWLRKYDAFLKSYGDAAYPPWPSRFAYSLAQMYLEITGSDILAAACTMNFALVPGATLHYAWVGARLIGECATAVYRRLGLGEHVGMPEGYRGAGAPDAPDMQTLRCGWTKVVKEAQEAREAMRLADTSENLCSAWNELCRLNALMVCVLTAHRGHRIERVTFGALTGSHLYVYASDKDVENGGSARLVPITTLLSGVIDWHMQCVALLAQRVRELVGPEETIAEFKRLGIPFNKAAFFHVRWNAGKQCLVRKVISPAALTDVSGRLWGARANVGRKFWVTQLMLRANDPFCTRLLTLHRRQGAEPDHPVHWQALEPALEALRATMEGVLAEANLTAPKCDLAPVELLSLRQAPLPRAAKESAGDSDAALAMTHRPGGFSLSAIAAVDSVRKELSIGVPPDHPQAALALACVVFDGITSLPVLRQLTSNPRKSLVRVGETAFLQARCGTNLIPYPLQPITHAILAPALSMPEPLPWPEVAAKASSWLREKLQGFCWGKDPLGQLLQAQGHWLNLRLPSMLNSAAEAAADIAAMSMRSCARLAGEEVHGNPTASATQRPRAPAVSAFSLDGLSRIIHHWGSDQKNLGGDVDRARGLQEDLSQLHPGEAGSPFASVHAWATQEAISILSGAPGYIQNSSLSTYFSNLSAALKSLSPLEDLRSWSDEQWRDLHRLVRHLAGDKDRGAEAKSPPTADRDPAFFRFGRALAAYGGYSIPGWMLEPTRRSERAVVKSAAAVHVGPRHFRLAEQILKRWLEDEPWALTRCTVLLKYLEEIPSRMSEPTTLVADCLTSDGQYVVLRPNGFNILKTTTSKRLLRASDGLAASIRQLRAFSQGVAANLKFLFLTDNETTESAVEIVHLVRTALEEAVGDPDLVLHSTRASAIIRTIAPGWDEVLRQLLRHDAGPATTAALFVYEQDKWQRPALAASLAGHAERRTLVASYGAAWPLLRYLALASTLVDIKIGLALLATANVSPAALRQARSRSRREGAVFDQWLWWCKHLARPEIPEFEFLNPLMSDPQDADLRHTNAADPRAPALTQLAAKLRYFGKRYLGIDLDVAAASERIGIREARLLEPAVDMARTFPPLTQRVKSTSSLRGKAADLKWIDLPDAVSWLSGCDSFDDAQVRALWSLLIREACPNRHDSSAYVDLVTGAMKVLPAETTLEFVFGQRHHSAELGGALSAAGAVVGKPHRDFGAIPRVFVVRRGQDRNDVEKARLTAMVRLLVCAFVCVKEII